MPVAVNARMTISSRNRLSASIVTKKCPMVTSARQYRTTIAPSSCPGQLSFHRRPEHVALVPVLPIERVAARVIDRHERLAEAGPGVQCRVRDEVQRPDWL